MMRITILFIWLMLFCLFVVPINAENKKQQAKPLIAKLRGPMEPHDLSFIEHNKKIMKKIIAIGKPALKPLFDIVKIPASDDRWNFQVFQCVVELISQIGDDSTLDELVMIIGDKGREDIRPYLIRAVGCIASDKAFCILESIIKRNNNDSVSAVNEIKHIPDKKVIGLLFRILDKTEIRDDIKDRALDSLRTLLPLHNRNYNEFPYNEDRFSHIKLMTEEIKMWYKFNATYLKLFIPDTTTREGEDDTVRFIVDQESKVSGVPYEKWMKLSRDDKDKILVKATTYTLSEWKAESKYNKKAYIYSLFTNINDSENTNIDVDLLLPVLFRILDKSKDNSQRCNAVYRISKINNVAAIPKLIAEILKQKDEVKKEIYKALMKLTKTSIESPDYNKWSRWWESNKTRMLRGGKRNIIIPGVKVEPRYDGKSVSEWIKQLSSESASKRFMAASALGSLQSKAAIPWLIKAMEDKDNLVKLCASGSLRDITGKFYVDAAKWREWWEKNKDRILKEEAEKDRQLEQERLKKLQQK